MKRWISLMLVLCMLLPFTMVASAEEQNTDAAETTASAEKFDLEAHRAKANRKRVGTMSSSNMGQMVGNQYLEFVVADTDSGESGKFTMGTTGGNANFTSDNDKYLLFGHGDPWSSFTTIRINGEDYLFAADETVYYASELKTVSTMTVNQVKVIQTLQIVKNDGTGLEDTIRVHYSIQNNSGNSKSIGVRIMMDTMLGHNDGAPFKVPGVGNVTRGVELVGNQIPTYWQVFDDLNNPTVFGVGTFLKAGERKPDKVQFTSWGQVYDTLWNHTVDPDYEFYDSAVAVYWNPQNLGSGNTTTVSTYYGVGYSDSGTAQSVTPVPANGFSIRVMDEDSNPIAGAKVKATNVDGEPEVTTDASGMAVFNKVPSGTGNTRSVYLNVEKSGYQNAASVCRTVEKGGSAAVVLFPNDGKAHIASVTGTINGSSLDLLSKNKYFQSDPEGVEQTSANTVTFEINVDAYSEARISKYRLIQGGSVKVESSSPKIQIPVLTGTPSDPDKYGADLRITKLDAGKTVYLQVIDENGNASARKALGIRVSEPTLYGFTDTKGSLNFGDKLKFTVPSGVPIWGDTEVELGWNGLPFEFEIFEDGKVKFAINCETEHGTGSVDGTKIANWDNIAKSYQDAMADVTSGRSSMGKAFGGTPQKFGAGTLKVNTEIMGYGEGFIDEHGNVCVNVGIVMTISQSASYTWTFFLGYVPVYISIGEKVSLSGSGEINIVAGDGNVSVAGAVGEINPKLTLNLDGGIGANGALNVGASGRATVSWVNRWTDGYNKVSLTGGVYLVATAFLFKAEKKLAEGTWVIYDSYRGYAETLNDDDNPSFYDAAAYSPVSRDYLNTPVPMTNNADMIRYGVYPDAAPTWVPMGDQSVLFWLEDIAERAANDRTALVYISDLNGERTVRQVFPETETSTADFAYDVFMEGTKAHIVVSKANRQFGTEEVTIDDMAASADIWYVCLDTATNTLSEPVRITDNAYSNTMPSVIVVDGQVRIAFAQNRMEEGLFGQSNTYHVCVADLSGNVTEQAVTGLIREVDMGVLNGEAVTAYIVDTDRNFETDTDAQLFKLTTAGAVQLTAAGTAPCALTFTAMKGENMLVWHAAEGMQSLASGNAVAPVFAEGASAVGKNFAALENANGGLKLIWEATSLNENQSGTVIYAVENNGAGWSNPYILYQSENELAGALSGFSGDTDYMVQVVKTGISGDEIYTALQIIGVEPKSDAVLSGVSFEDLSMIPGSELPMTLSVSNNGFAAVDTLTVYADGTQIATIENAGLAAGQTKEYEVGGYILDEALNGATDVRISIAADNDMDDSNNTQIVTVGYVDVGVKAEHMLVNEQDWANIVLTNHSGINASGLLRIHADEEDGAVLYERQITDLTSDYTESILLNLSELGAGGDIDVFYISFAANEDEAVLFNNESILYMGLANETTHTLSVTAGYGGTISGSLGGDYAQGETVEITAVPDKGYVFSRWVSDGGSFEDANEATTVFTMPNSNVVVEAVFEEYEHECVFTNYYSDNNATCMEDGTKTAECDYCRATDTILDEGSMLDHHYVNGCCVRCGQMEGVQLTPMYRLYNPNSGEHHFTGSVVERDNLTNLGWQYEGIGWYAPINGGAPVYRTFNPNSGDHHYTMSWDEVENLMEAGWAYEGVAWNSAGPDMTPQYRMYNPNADLGSHHYTSSVEERDTLIGYGWRWEGIGWFGYDQPA